MVRALLSAKEQGASGIDLATTAAIGGVVVAIAALVVGGWRTRRQIAVENMWRLIDRFDGQRGRAQRAAAASYLLEHFPTPSHKELPLVVTEVLDTLELLGYLVRRKTLAVEDVWTNFPGAIQWWHVCEPVIQNYQRGDPTIYEDFARLVKKLLRVETKRRGSRAGQRPSEDDLKDFLRNELKIGGTTPGP